MKTTNLLDCDRHFLAKSSGLSTGVIDLFLDACQKSEELRYIVEDTVLYRSENNIYFSESDDSYALVLPLSEYFCNPTIKYSLNNILTAACSIVNIYDKTVSLETINPLDIGFLQHNPTPECLFIRSPLIHLTSKPNSLDYYLSTLTRKRRYKFKDGKKEIDGQNITICEVPFDLKKAEEDLRLRWGEDEFPFAYAQAVMFDSMVKDEYFNPVTLGLFIEGILVAQFATYGTGNLETPFTFHGIYGGNSLNDCGKFFFVHLIEKLCNNLDSNFEDCGLPTSLYIDPTCKTSPDSCSVDIYKRAFINHNFIRPLASVFGTDIPDDILPPYIQVVEGNETLFFSEVTNIIGDPV